MQGGVVPERLDMRIVPRWLVVGRGSLDVYTVPRGIIRLGSGADERGSRVHTQRVRGGLLVPRGLVVVDARDAHVCRGLLRRHGQRVCDGQAVPFG